MKVFKYEQAIAELIEKNNSISYTSVVLKEPVKQVEEDPQSIKRLIEATQDNNEVTLANSGTYKLYSILVTTAWNLNDDIFDPVEVWMAKDTPLHMQSNIEHNQKCIVGTITDCWPVNDQYDLIYRDTPVSELPAYYHLLTSSVIYTKWRDEGMSELVAKLIDDIENNRKWVSMECTFDGFDYAVISPEGKNYIIERNEETSFLTQHLLAYGGTGVYQGHRIGRLLRSISFIGKGYTDNPANPPSRTFDSSKQFVFDHAVSNNNLFILDNGVKENSDVPSENNTEKIMENEQLIADLQSQLEAANANIATLTQQLTDMTSKVADLESLVANVTTERDTYKNEVVAMKETTKKKDRMGKMKAKCSVLTDDEVEAKVSMFSSLTDDQFDAMISLIATPVATVTVTETTTTVEASEIVEEVESSTATHSLSSSSEDENKTQKSLEALAESIFSKKKANNS